MGRYGLGGQCSAVLFLLFAVFASLIAGLHPARVRAQGTSETVEPAAAPARVAPPTTPEAAPPQDSPPARRPWREAMERAPASERDASTGTERVWYGWQTLLIDLTGIGLVALSAEDEGFTVAGLIVIGLGSPIVHFAHQNSSAGVISFAIRATSIGLLFLGAALIADGFISDDGSSGDTLESIGVVAAIASIPGALAAVIIDASLLAFDTRPRAPERASLTPWIDTRRGSYGLRFALSL
jgi:hypothetical protein